MVLLRLLVVGLVALVIFDPQIALARDLEKQPTATGRGGAAATVDLLGTRAAIETLEEGGNAVDAVVAAAAVLGVTEPYSCGIGGGGFMTIRTPEGEVTTIDSREESPAAMVPDSFFENGAALTFEAARWSGLSAGVPGTVAGWERALRRYGTQSLARTLRPGIEVARAGFTVDQTFVDQTTPALDYFDDIPSTAELYVDEDGTAPDVGDTIRNRDLARTYRMIAREGPRAFYRGELAEAIVEAVTSPPVGPKANHTWRPGLLTEQDLRNYEALRRDPTHMTYRGLDVWGMGPPSSGGSTVGEILNILEGYDLAAMPRERALHLYLEASRYAYADRNAYLGDPDFVDVPLAGLLSDSFAAERRDLITETAATSPVAPGDPSDDPQPVADASASATRVGSTTNLTVTDRDGNVVDYTFTIEQTGGNGMVVPGYGFLLNNELTDFNISSDGTSPDSANQIAGGKRPRSSIAPTIVLRDGAPLLALGSPGGASIITTVAQTLLNRLDFGMTLPDAIAAPRLSQRNSATTQTEAEFLGTPEAAALEARGHSFTVSTGTGAQIGAVTANELLGGGTLLSAAEPVRRGGGSAMVLEPGG
jgi:gamma-glutamyltranspeptidase / glutathione hydrolase